MSHDTSEELIRLWRTRTRVETLRELALLARAGVPITAASLDAMADAAQETYPIEPKERDDDYDLH